MRRYAAEVSPTKRGCKWEQIRISAFESQLPIDKQIKSITTDILGQWRDERLKQVAPGSVLREISILSSVFETARREWGWIEVNPIKDVRKPRAPDHREVTITRAQIKKMLKAMGYKPRGRVTTISQSVAVCFLLALRTGMRAGELCNLEWKDINPSLTSRKKRPIKSIFWKNRILSVYIFS